MWLKKSPFSWCNPYNSPHKKENSLIPMEVSQLAFEMYNDVERNSINYVGDIHDMINAISNPSN
jgi:hypothetical protein